MKTNLKPKIMDYMERKLIICNFGAIASAEINLKDFNIFIGEQGSGKSTIAKLITIFQNNAIELLKTDSDLFNEQICRVQY